MGIRNVINIGARCLTSGLALLAAKHLIVIGLLVKQMGGGWKGLVPIALGLVFIWPAFVTLFGGILKWIRGFWIVTAVLSAAGILYAPTQEGGIDMLIYSILGLVISFGATEKKTDEEAQAAPS